MRITETMVTATARQAGLGEPAAVRMLKRENDVASILGNTGTFFLNTSRDFAPRARRS